MAAEAQALVEAGGWEDEGYGDGDLYLRRVFDDQDQAVFEPEHGPLGTYRLSQVQANNFLSEPKQKDFNALEEALREAEAWRKDVKVGTDPTRKEAWDAHLERKMEEAVAAAGPPPSLTQP